VAQPERLDLVLGRILTERDSSIRSVSRLSGVSRRTLENWLSGHTRQPRGWHNLVRVALALRLNAAETDALLHAAGQPPLAQLHATVGAHEPDVAALWAQTGRDSEVMVTGIADLPSPVTPFVGRETAVAALEALLQQPQSRLITISGMGGIGKTRLALTVAERLRNRFDGGVYFAALEGITTADGFWEQLLQDCNIGMNGGSSAETLVCSFFRTRFALLVCDNFEQLADHAALTTRLLTRCRRLRVLVTSRFRLGLYAEQVFPLKGLQQAEDAQALFVQTARRLQPDYAPDPGEMAEIGALCKAVAGMPLAIELAASWIDLLTPAEMLTTLVVDPVQLGQPSADRPPRQHSLAALFEATWRLLNPGEQAAALRLTVLEDNYSRTAAMTVAQLSPAMLQRLIGCSLLQPVDDQRLWMHDLLRQFLRRKAAVVGLDEAAGVERYCMHYLGLLAELGGELRRSMRYADLKRLSTEWQHVERAWELALKYGQYDLIADCGDVVMYFEARRRWRQGVRFLRRTLDQLPPDRLHARACCEAGLALLSVRLFDVVSAERQAKRALALYEQLGIKQETRYAQLALTIVDFAIRRRTDRDNFAAALLDAGAGSFEAFTDMLPLLLQGAAACKRGDFEQAIRDHQALFDRYGADLYSYPDFSLMLGLSYLGNGNIRRARELFQQAFHWAQRYGGLPTLVASAFELSHLDNPTAPFAVHLHAVQTACSDFGPIAAGYAAIHVGVQYLPYGFGTAGRQLSRIGLAILREEVGQREWVAVMLFVGTLLLAQGVIQRLSDWTLAPHRPGGHRAGRR
jgi:tetratricopeptide (TPR) repeat protein